MNEETEKKLIKAALEGTNNAFVGSDDKPESFRFGAAVLTKKNNIYSSGQYTSSTHSLTLHAEQAVLAHAASHGEYDIVAIVITANEAASNNEIIYPCHMCKQLLWESHLYSKEDIEIILLDSKGKILEKLNLVDIINYPWPKK